VHRPDAGPAEPAATAAAGDPAEPAATGPAERAATAAAGDPADPGAAARPSAGPGSSRTRRTAFGLSPADRLRRRGLVRMKLSATALLLLAAVVYVIARRAGGHGWVGFVEAAAEAGMVGGLADWFAVTALFRHPLAIPIPHTAIIPTRKDALGRTLSDFVGTNFLSEQVIRERLRNAGVPARVGRWLADPEHAARVTAELARALRGAVDVLRDEDVRAVLEPVVLRRLGQLPVGPTLGRLLAQVVEDRAHHRLVDLVAAAVDDWLRANREQVIDLVARQAPPWSPEFVDRAVATRIYAELARVSAEVRAEPEHAIRQALDRMLARFADDLRHDQATIERASGVLEGLLAQPELRRAFGDVISAGRRLLLEMVDDPDSELRSRMTAGLAELGHRLDTDDALRTRVDGIQAEAAGYVVTHYRDELTRTITDTVERWDGVETARKVELAVGRDLQFIRINGTVVGALAGVVIHAVGVLVS
jgi:uncharacterized membrane-anchored protein YjiN (DUF445 family)